MCIFHRIPRFSSIIEKYEERGRGRERGREGERERGRERERGEREREGEGRGGEGGEEGREDVNSRTMCIFHRMPRFSSTVVVVALIKVGGERRGRGEGEGREGT